MTKIERAELETDIEEIDASIDELTVAIIGLTDKPRAAVVLLDALDLATRHAGRIRYLLEQADNADED